MRLSVKLRLLHLYFTFFTLKYTLNQSGDFFAATRKRKISEFLKIYSLVCGNIILIVL